MWADVAEDSQKYFPDGVKSNDGSDPKIMSH